MNRRSVLVLVALVGCVAVFLMLRDPVGAAGVVRAGWGMLVSGVTTVVESAITFLRHLFR